MSERSERGFEVVARGGGVCFRLPRRPLGRWRLVGLLFIGFGLMFEWFAAGWTWHMLRMSLGQGKPMHVMEVVSALLGAGFLVAGLMPVLVGLGILQGHNEVVLTARYVRSVEGLGPLRWSRRRLSIESRRRLQVAGRGAGEGAAVEPLNALLALGEAGTSLFRVLAWGYSHETLLGLSRELLERCEGMQPAPVVHGAHSPAIIVESVRVDSEDQVVPQPPGDPRPARPTDTACVLEHHEEGATITIPPTGLVKGSKGLFAFAILWLILTGGLCTFFVVASTQPGSGLPLPGAVVFFVLFFGVGIAMLLGGINMGRRRAILDVVGGMLLVSRRGIFGVRQWQWACGELETIRMGPSGMEMNEEPIMCLQIVRRAGRTVRILSQLRDEKLLWIAGELRAALKLSDRGTPTEFAAGAIGTAGCATNAEAV